MLKSISIVTKKSIFEKKTVNVLSEKVAILEEKLQSKYNESNPSSKQIFQCDYGNYKASTKSVLKRHITSKQKENITIPKKEWSKGQDSSLLITIDERAETLYSPPQPHDKDLTNMQLMKETVYISFKCEHCDTESISASTLKNHIDFKHNISIQHTLKWTQNKCHICDNQFSTPCKIRSHMTSKYNFWKILMILKYWSVIVKACLL